MENNQVDVKATLEFLESISEEALQAARAGNTTLANNLGRNTALAHYFNNVHTLKAIRQDTWTQIHYPYLQEADRIRRLTLQQEQAEANQERLNTLESKMDSLLGMVESLLKADEDPIKESKPAKKSSKKAVKESEDETEEDPVESDETPADESEESES